MSFRKNEWWTNEIDHSEKYKNDWFLKTNKKTNKLQSFEQIKKTEFYNWTIFQKDLKKTIVFIIL